MGTVTGLGIPAVQVNAMAGLLRSIDAAAPADRGQRVIAAEAMKVVATAFNPQLVCLKLLLLDFESGKSAACMALGGSWAARAGVGLILVSASSIDDLSRFAALSVAQLALPENPMLVSVCEALSGDDGNVQIHKMLILEGIKFSLEPEIPAAVSETLVPVQPRGRKGRTIKLATNDAGMQLVLAARRRAAVYVPIDPSDSVMGRGNGLRVAGLRQGTSERKVPAQPDIRVPVPHDKRSLLDQPLPLGDTYEVFGMRTTNCFRADDKKFIGDLVQRTESEMLKTKNFGRKSLKEIKEWLWVEHGLTFNVDVGAWRRPA